MGNYVASNLGNSRLVGAITESTKTISIQVADIFKFPVVNNGGVGSEYTMLTFQDAANRYEIVKVTRRDAGSSSFTIERAQEGTTARPWATGDVVSCRLTAGVVGDSFAAVQLAASKVGDAAASAAAAKIASDQAKASADNAIAQAAAAGAAAAAAVATAYPVGSIYINASNTANPASLFGFGTWAKFGEGRMLMSEQAYSYPLGTTGGSADSVVPLHVHSVRATTTGMSANESHSHTATDSGHDHSTFVQNQIGGTSSGPDANWWTKASAATGTGHANITVSQANINHTHDIVSLADETGVDPAGRNLPPFIVVYMWQRTA